MSKYLLIYIYDAYCSWCYGFSPVIKQLAQDYKARCDLEVLSGGMIIGNSTHPISHMAPYIQGVYRQVEALTGIRFGTDFLWHIFHPQESDWQLNSEKPAIALCVFKHFYPEEALSFVSDLQYALNYEGRDLGDDEAYRHLLEKYRIPPDVFYRLLHSKVFKEQAYHEFSLVKQLQVSGFPTLLLQENESKLHLLARGFIDYNTLDIRLQNVLASLPG